MQYAHLRYLMKYQMADQEILEAFAKEHHLEHLTLKELISHVLEHGKTAGTKINKSYLEKGKKSS